MDKSEPIFTLSKPKWSWVKIDSQLKTKLDGKITKLSLKPTVTFESTQSNQESNKILQKIVIDTEKSLQYENQVGWNWHKSSNLPIISIKIQVKQEDSENLLPLPENLEARIFATKIIVNALQRNQIAFLEDVGIRGSSKIQLKEGCGLFNGIRFSSTSYNNQGVKFYLLIVIYGKTEGNKIENIISSVLSPPIFVDSRKSARDYQEKRFLSFVELFEPNLFSKDFIKRENKTKPQAITKINNSLDGLFNYLTAPNIRHKVKHPIFLSTKFSNAFKIQYNKNHFDYKEINVQQLIKKLQKKLIKDIGGERKSKKISSRNMNKPFMISLHGQCTAHRKSKILECLQFLDCKAIQLVQYPYQIPKHYTDISQVGNVIDAYTNNYAGLLKIYDKDISIRKTKEQQAVEMSAKDDFNDSQEENGENVQNQCKSQNQYHSKSVNIENSSNQSENQDYSYNIRFARRYNPKNRRTNIQENMYEPIKKRINNNMKPQDIVAQNPINIVAQNLLEPMMAEQNKGPSMPMSSAFKIPEIKIQKQLDYLHNMGYAGQQLPLQNGPNFHNEQISFNPQQNPQILQGFTKQVPHPLISLNNLIGPPSVPLQIQSLQLSKDKFMENMDHQIPNIKPQIIKQQKEQLKNQIISQINLQNDFLQQMIVDNQMMKSKVQMLFEYGFLQQHNRQENKLKKDVKCSDIQQVHPLLKGNEIQKVNVLQEEQQSQCNKNLVEEQNMQQNSQ